MRSCCICWIFPLYLDAVGDAFVADPRNDFADALAQYALRLVDGVVDLCVYIVSLVEEVEAGSVLQGGASCVGVCMAE